MAESLPQRFKNRRQAGELLAQRLHSYADRNDVVVVALPRGGVPVAFVMARDLDAPLDVLLVRKLGLPGHEEYAMGAIASGGVCILQAEAVSGFNVPPEVIETIAQRELKEIDRREKLYRAGRPPLQLRERVVIVVDDGLATGSTMEVALHVIREANPARLIAAVPVAPVETCERLRDKVDEMVCLSMPEPFNAVGQWYENFEQTADAEVQALLEQAQREHGKNRHVSSEGR